MHMFYLKKYLRFYTKKKLSHRKFFLNFIITEYFYVFNYCSKLHKHKLDLIIEEVFQKNHIRDSVLT